MGHKDLVLRTKQLCGSGLPYAGAKDVEEAKESEEESEGYQSSGEEDHEEDEEEDSY
jgi:hypothetical protein